MVLAERGEKDTEDRDPDALGERRPWQVVRQIPARLVGDSSKGKSKVVACHVIGSARLLR